jgi:hypothetical protein
MSSAATAVPLKACTAAESLAELGERSLVTDAVVAQAVSANIIDAPSKCVLR